MNGRGRRSLSVKLGAMSVYKKKLSKPAGLEEQNESSEVVGHFQCILSCGRARHSRNLPR